MQSLILSAAISIAAISLPAIAQAQDAAAGEKIFKRCASCHTVNEGGKNNPGPNLWGVFGSTAGQRDIGFKNFSPAIKKSGVLWNDETMAAFIETPRKFIPKTRMSFPGIKNAKQRDDVIAYLKSVTQ